MSITGVITAIVVGLILGVLGRMIAPGRQKIPWWLTILVGIAAAFLGTAIARLFGVDQTNGIDWIELVLQIIVAVIGVMAVAAGWARMKGGRGAPAA